MKENILQCISCGVSHRFEIHDIIAIYNNGTFKATVVFEWTCEQCKTINRFACYGNYIKVN